MTLSLIVAVGAKNFTIGKNNQLLWKIPEDLKRFRELTTNKIIIMGRKTHKSIGRALPNRINIVISKTMEPPGKDILVYKTTEDAIVAGNSFIKQFDMSDEIMVIGGGEIYKQFLPKADKLYLTIVSKEYQGDTYFPEIEYNDWNLEQFEDHKEFCYKTYNRRFKIDGKNL